MKTLLLSIAVAVLAACNIDTNVMTTSRGELKISLPDAGTPEFQVSHDFGSVKTGESTKLAFNVVNTGADALDIRVVRIDTTDTSAFFVQGGSGSVEPHLTRAFSVTFAPSRTGAHTGTLIFETNARAESARISLTGTGAAP